MSYETVTVMLVFSLFFIDLNMKGPNKHMNLKKKAIEKVKTRFINWIVNQFLNITVMVHVLFFQKVINKTSST